MHPNIECNKSMLWMEGIFLKYHVGHKTDEKGKPKFIEPAGGPWQELPQQFQWSEYIVTSVSADPDLLDGVISAGIRPKNVTDVLMLQRHKRPAARLEYGSKLSQCINY